MPASPDPSADRSDAGDADGAGSDAGSGDAESGTDAADVGDDRRSAGDGSDAAAGGSAAGGIDWSAYADDVAVVVPTIADEVLTLESVPDGVPVHVEREGTLNEARNRGVARSDAEVVMIVDDDVAFPPDLLRDLFDRALAAPETMLGLADWDYGWTAGRVMIFHKRVWADVGGFDERLRSHMGDTEFALKLLRHGYELERLPRELFYHEDHERSISTRDHVWRLPYLCLRYPRRAPTLVAGMARGWLDDRRS